MSTVFYRPFNFIIFDLFTGISTSTSDSDLESYYDGCDGDDFSIEKTGNLLINNPSL